MRQSAFATYDNRTTYELWCDAMVEKAKNRRSTRPQVFVMKPRPVQPEPTYSNYELQKMFKNLLTNQPKGAILKAQKGSERKEKSSEVKPTSQEIAETHSPKVMHKRAGQQCD